MPPNMEPTAFAPCPTCAGLVLAHVWRSNAGHGKPRWKRQSVPLTPITGEVHMCLPVEAQQQDRTVQEGV